jgi:hypothetical protein
LALNQITGSSLPQGVAAVLVGVVLIRISLRLIKRSHDFLVGVWVITPAPRTAMLMTSHRRSRQLKRKDCRPLSPHILE